MRDVHVHKQLVVAISSTYSSLSNRRGSAQGSLVQRELSAKLTEGLCREMLRICPTAGEFADRTATIPPPLRGTSLYTREALVRCYLYAKFQLVFVICHGPPVRGKFCKRVFTNGEKSCMIHPNRVGSSALSATGTGSCPEDEGIFPR